MQNEIRTLTDIDLRQSSVLPVDALGAAGFTSDNRQFSYVHAGASNITAGQLVVTPAVVANHQGLSLAAGSQTAKGTTTLQLTLGATAATQDQYADGFLTVVTNTGAGLAYKIKGNSPAVLSGTITVNLYNTEPLLKAVDSTTTFNLTDCSYDQVITSTTASHAVGVAACDIPATNYGWCQTYGFCAVLIKGSISKGNSIIQSTSTAGAVSTASGSSALLGNTLENCTDGQYNSVWLQIT